MNSLGNYGVELILDFHKCNVSKFNRKDISIYFSQLCELIDMEAYDCHFWEEEDDDFSSRNPKTVGISAVQFIMTSNITIHALNLLESVYVNIFSCKDFDVKKALEFTTQFFEGRIVNQRVIERI